MFLLSRLYGMSYLEIAERLGVSLRTVNRNIGRVADHLLQIVVDNKTGVSGCAEQLSRSERKMAASQKPPPPIRSSRWTKRNGFEDRLRRWREGRATSSMEKTVRIVSGKASRRARTSARREWLLCCDTARIFARWSTVAIDFPNSPYVIWRVMRYLLQRKRFSLRSVMASVTLCLFLLQGLATSIPSLLVGDAAAGVTASIDGRFCKTHFGDGAPAQDHRSHALCCIGCVSNRDASPLFFAALFSIDAYSLPEAVVSSARFSMANSRGPPVGWITSWSSRAPPLFS